MADRPIGDYALLGDGHSAALVSGAGSIDWLCLPRFDSPATFARLLDEGAGHWSICPSGEHESRRRYLPGTLVLETQFATPSGMAMMTEAMVFDDRARGHDLGAASPHVLVRVLEVTEGEVPIDAVFAPRPEYGLVAPKLVELDGGLLCQGGAGTLVLAGPPPTFIGDDVAHWRIALRKGEQAAWALQLASTWDDVPQLWSSKQIEKRLADTVSGWRSWSELHQRYEGPWRDEVHHSGRVLQALTFAPTGAIVAAPTTSLPEQEGGSRNWDYRYCWLRDASMTMQALWIAACPDEAGRFFSFITRAAGGGTQLGTGLQIMYGIGGEHDLSERDLPHLSGWRNSRPVRVGNGAWNQLQHDVYGAVLDAVYRFRDQVGELAPPTRAFLAGLADTAAVAWRDPDHGMWELRGEPRHFLHSKLMCWVALDRAVRMVDQLDDNGRAATWGEAAEEVKAAILEEGWNQDLGAFTQTFGGDHLDASALLLAITGFLPATDVRMRSTIDAVADELSAPCGLLYRYRDDDGLPGEESTFLLCSFWLVECWALAGELEKAHDVFERAVAYANDVGLLAEEAEPMTGELLGNYPQAFSHIGLVNAAWAVARAESGASADGES